ncbi:MAG: HEAT repeat domain-containing protein [Vicinamibacteria bacterium]
MSVLRQLMVSVAFVIPALAQAQGAGIADVVQRLRSGDPAVQRSALFDARRLGAGAGRGATGADLVGALIEVLDGPDYLHRMFAAQAIGFIRPAASEVTSALVRVARDAGQPSDDQESVSSARLAAIDALREVRADRGTLLDVIAEALSDHNPRVRGGACMLAANVRPDAPEMLPRLKELAASDPSDQVRLAAETAASAMEKSLGAR